jgi:hypothetical protein
MLRVWEGRPRSPELPLSGEGLKGSPHTMGMPGLRSSRTMGCRKNTPCSFGALRAVLTLESRGSVTHIPRQITTPLNLFRMYITLLSKRSLPPAAMSVRSHAVSWRWFWAPSRPPHCPSSLKYQNRASTGQCIISPTLTTCSPTWLRSTHTSTVITSRVHGAPSPPSPCLYPAFPQAPRPQSTMLPRPTGPSRSSQPNGPVWWSACRLMISLQSTCATTLASLQLGVYMGWWQMPELTYSEATALARWRSGSTTMFSSGFHAGTCPNTMHSARSGSVRFSPMEAAGKRAAVCGTAGKTS